MSQDETPIPDPSPGGAQAAPRHEQVRSRNQAFAERTATRIWRETPSPTNPYIAQQALCYGYDLVELMQGCSFVEVFYLLLRGELPSREQAQLLEQLMIALVNPGPRHPATRAAMNAAIGKTDPVHILPIALGVLGGKHEGAGEIEAAMRFLRKASRQPAEQLAQQLVWPEAMDTPVDDEPPAPGFGRHYGGIDLLTRRLAEQLLCLPGAGSVLSWGEALAAQLAPQGRGWLATGLAAAVFCDLGFQPRAGACLYQLMAAPGLVAHGLELANKPITAMPFVKDEHYVIERE